MISDVITDTITTASCLKIAVHWKRTNIARNSVTYSTVITT